MRAGLVCSVVFLVGLPELASAGTLQEMYDRAPADQGYDRYIVLATGVTYTGGLWIGGTYEPITAQFEPGGENVRIVGNGAILDLQGGEICVAYGTHRLDIDDCIILQGDIRFRGYTGAAAALTPTGSVRHCTFYHPHDYGVRTVQCGAGILIERNIIVGAVDTGADFLFLNGYATNWLPTGGSVSLSLVGGAAVVANWSYHEEPAVNADPVRHFNVLCDYG